MREQRRLAAIVAADVVGYSRLMGRDESGTVARLRQVRAERLQPVLALRGGRIVKLTGDGALIEFGSAVEALSAAIEFQQSIADSEADKPETGRLVFRVGVHLGDVIVDGDDLYGDGVNVAARLEAEAPAGGIVVSGDMHNFAAGRVAATFEDLGRLSLKNIERPVQAYAVRWQASDWTVASTVFSRPATAAPAPPDTPLPLPDKPSIAVLPFQNMSGDPEQEYFVDGISEDIITELTRFRSLFVIARNSSFSYKGKSPDIRDVGRELGVRYVLEGSVRRASNRLRVTAQLVDSQSANHIWAERYDRQLDDVFALQEELTRSIVRAIAPQVWDMEASKAARRRPENIGAYEIAIRARAKLNASTGTSDFRLREEALTDARAALAMDPASTHALGVIALGQWQHVQWGTAPNIEAARHEGLVAADRAVALDPGDCLVHSIRGMLLVLAIDETSRREGLASLERSYELNPNDTRSLSFLAYGKIKAGDSAAAIELLQEAMRISPRDPLRFLLLFQFSRASFALKAYTKSVEYAELGIGERPGFVGFHRQLALSLVGLGEYEKAKAALSKARSMAPEYVNQGLAGNLGYDDPEQQRRSTVFMRIAADLEDPTTADALQ